MSMPHVFYYSKQVLPLQRVTPPVSQEADIAPFWLPNGSVMCCDTAGSGCQNSGPCSTPGQLFWRVLDWISASQQPAPRLTRNTLSRTHSEHRVLPRPAYRGSRWGVTCYRLLNYCTILSGYCRHTSIQDTIKLLRDKSILKGQALIRTTKAAIKRCDVSTKKQTTDYIYLLSLTWEMFERWILIYVIKTKPLEWGKTY